VNEKFLPIDTGNH